MWNDQSLHVFLKGWDVSVESIAWFKMCVKDQSCAAEMNKRIKNFSFFFLKSSLTKREPRNRNWIKDNEVRTCGFVLCIWQHGVWKCTQLSPGLMFPPFFSSPSKSAEEFSKKGTPSKQQSFDCRWANTSTKHGVSFIIYYLALLYKSPVRDLHHTMNSKMLTQDLYI